MKNKTFWIGLIVVFIVMQALGYVIHEVLMGDTYEKLASIFRPEAEMMDMMWMMMVSGAVMMFMFCYIFTRGYEGKGIMEGVRFGFLIGLLMAGPMAIDPHVIYPVPADVATIWLISSVMSLIIAGAVFASIYKPDSGG
ncbi:MAG: DUF1761 family protein [Gammaproteobacteria bacterium]|nr:MAG: DUF1761 family protein [Gammaproteobacteria bacterium]